MKTDPSGRDPDAAITARLLEILGYVWDMQYASDHARSWTQPGSCGIGKEMPCRHERCIERAAYNTGYWATIAAHNGNLLAAALCAVRDETLSHIEPYIQHKDDCPAPYCWDCGQIESADHAHDDIPFMCGIGFRKQPCNCGLAALRAGGGGA